MSILFLLELALVVLFLVMFLRRPSPTWGIGLLTISSAVLFDTFITTFNEEAVRADLGFFYFVIVGLLVGGAALWLMGMLWPLVAPAPSAEIAPVIEQPERPPLDPRYDRQLLKETIRNRLRPDQLDDLLFDLDIDEKRVYTPGQPMMDSIDTLLDTAEIDGKTGQLAVAVERILTPPPIDHLPRLAKLSAATPPAVLRQWLNLQYSAETLQQVATDLTLDWDNLPGVTKSNKIVSILRQLQRNGRTAELISWMQAHAE